MFSLLVVDMCVLLVPYKLILAFSRVPLTSLGIISVKKLVNETQKFIINSLLDLQHFNKVIEFSQDAPNAFQPL